MKDIRYKFLLVHDSETNDVMLFNSERIAAVYINQEDELPTVCLSDGTEFTCNETPNRIYETIGEWGFLRLHSREGNWICLVNMQYVMSVYRNGDETLVSIKSDDEEIEISVNEKPERIYNLIKDANGILEKQTTKKKQIKDIKETNDASAVS